MDTLVATLYSSPIRDALGQRTKCMLPNGMTTEYAYDDDGLWNSGDTIYNYTRKRIQALLVPPVASPHFRFSRSQGMGIPARSQAVRCSFPRCAWECILPWQFLLRLTEVVIYAGFEAFRFVGGEPADARVQQIGNTVTVKGKG